MKKQFQILTILMAVLVFLSPVLSFASVLGAEEHQTEMEMSCCTTDDSSDSEHDCCHTESPMTKNKSCGDTNCPTNDCHLHQISVFHVYFPQDSQEKEIQFISPEKLKSYNYSSLSIKDLSFSFWNPPKYIFLKFTI